MRGIGATIVGNNHIPETVINSFLSSILQIGITGVGGYYGVDKIDHTLAPTPEPGNSAMILAGLALVGGVARRRSAR